MSPSLDRLRIALKFSLWTWALYWPGGGLLLLYGGLDPISIAVTFGSLGAFILLLATGALKANSSRNMRQFIVERPLYLLAAFIVLILLAALVPSAEVVALLLFAALWFGGLTFVGLRLHEHLREDKKPVWGSRADQLYLVLGLSAFFSLFVLLDALIPVLAGDDAVTTGTPESFVAVCTWMNLLYPGLVMVASRPFREPLRLRFWRKAPADPDGLPAAARRRKSTEPRPFRAS